MTEPAITERYIELLKRALTGEVHEHTYTLQGPYIGPRRLLHYVAADALRRVVRRRGIEPVRRADPERLRSGKDWPLVGETMVGRKRLDNVHVCVETVSPSGVPGDLIETGVWRGGAAIFMRGLLAAHGVTDRTGLCADSFAGLPPPTPSATRRRRRPPPHGRRLAVSLDEVQATSSATGCSTTRSDSSRAGSRTRCRPSATSSSRSSAWTATCTSRRWTGSRTSIRSSRPAASSSSTTTPRSLPRGRRTTASPARHHRGDCRHRQRGRLLAQGRGLARPPGPDDARLARCVLDRHVVAEGAQV